MQLTVVVQTDEEEPPPKVEVSYEPPYGTTSWIQYWSDFEGHLPTPIDVSITDAIKYPCPELKWYNFDVFPHKIKMTNTGYTVLLGSKWKAERPYLEGGPFLEKHVLSQIHFHWGADMMEGSEHTVDKRRHPGEMQVTFFKSEYMTQEEALRHNDGVVMICYMIKIPEGGLVCYACWVYFSGLVSQNEGPNPRPPRTLASQDSNACVWCRRSLIQRRSHALSEGPERNEIARRISPRQFGVNPDARLSWVIEGFPRIREAKTHTRIGPYPMSRLLPMFHEDYFLYWGKLKTVSGDSYMVRWLVPRITLFASFDQMKEFRKLWDPWDEPNLRNYRPLQERQDRHVFFISPHWCQYNSLLPIPRVPEASISVLSPAYEANMWMLPPQNAYMLPQPELEEGKVETKEKEI